MHVAQELLDRLGEHQPAPHQRRLLADEEAGRHDLERAGADLALVRDDLGLVRPVDPLGLHPIGDAEQPRHREAPDVGVEHADDVAGGRQRGGQVDRDRALADAALAAGDREHAARQRDLGVGRPFAGMPARLEHHVGALLGVHLAPHDANVGDAGVDADARLDLALDVGAERAAADRQLDADRDDTVRVDIDRRHHAERHDVGAELGIDDRAEHGEHLVTTRGGDPTCRLSTHRSYFTGAAPCNLFLWSIRRRIARSWTPGTSTC